jgi:TRAP transporter TAXI family solute receptor
MNTMLKRLTILLVLAFLIGSTALAQRENWPRGLTIGTASVGGTYFIYGGGWANLIQQELGVPTSTEVTGGPNQNMQLIQNGDIELGMVTMGPAYEGWTGEGEWTGGMAMTDVRALFPMYSTPFHFIALEGSGITSVQDLNGRSVGVGPAGGTPGTYNPRFLDALGIERTDRFAGASDLASLLMDGQIDAFAFAAGAPISAFLEVEAQRPSMIFAFTEEEIEILLEQFPYANREVIPAGLYQSLDEDIATVGMYNFAVGHADLPEDFVYEMVKAVFENQQFLIETHQSASETRPENVDNNDVLPFHPGAIRYYNEIGIDIPEHLYPEGYSPEASN